MKLIRRLFYLGLEPLAARYTKQLCEDWFPAAVREASPRTNLTTISGETTDEQIQVGGVLDATGRGIYACTQVALLLKLIRNGSVSNEDAIFLQDFWTPGFEAVPYALHLCGLKPKIYSMLHAQSVDEYDFTWPMREWMRPMELGLTRFHSAIFVASTIHRDQLRAAGVQCPIHVVGLPIHARLVACQMSVPIGRRKNVIFCSRLDWEKNPGFMLQVAERFLTGHPNWTWTVTTSSKNFRSNDHLLLSDILSYARNEPRFILKAGLTKQQYYDELCNSSIQFNSSLQDYVSWTLLEAVIAGCELAYPDFRSFPEILPASRLYRAFNVEDACLLLNRLTEEHPLVDLEWIARRCDLGRIIEAEIITGVKADNREVNIWHGCI